ncbi:Gfo/Idh/MocA family oxidoreductase [Halomonas organivorans]|uniref:2-hydroxy-4-carboxymuconate semialdehyde hemiacetal dehydrogenase n=1 Tax=Halomonas organivorans TaxID=257772 RepID=A0A7W5BVJ6_9GAMM|nr:Gfo/Idh/MocA family oxidoreductase [Halomonas organivorans]MBB3139614.1 2-hydroxy-4-carboxymuconate semialdehyde hemiacetal dehydrogenase [Halomonas organivorans]
MSEQPLRLLLAGEGGIAGVHMRVLGEIPGVEVACLVGGDEADARTFAAEWQIPEVVLDMDTALTRDDLDAVILATPSPRHADQAERVIAAGKHLLCEIPMALSLADAERIVARAEASDRVCMVAHTRRFNPPHRELKRRLAAGEFHLQHLVSETYFFRRENLNMQGQPRRWVDNLLWHHACHSVDLFAWLLDDPEPEAWGSRGPDHPELGIPMDMSIGLRSRRGVLATLALSFNNRGPFGGFYRYIGEEDTFLAFRDELEDHRGESVPLSGSGFLDQDREFVAAIREGRAPEASFSSCLPSMRVLDRLQRSMASSQA